MPKYLYSRAFPKKYMVSIILCHGVDTWTKRRQQQHERDSNKMRTVEVCVVAKIACPKNQKSNMRLSRWVLNEKCHVEYTFSQYVSNKGPKSSKTVGGRLNE